MLSFFDGKSSATRREFLSVGSLGLAGLSAPLTLPALMQGARGADGRGNSPSTDKAVVMLMMQGGPSQFETFDPKLDGPEASRSATGVLRTSVPGTYFGGTFPHLARRAHRMAVVRSYMSGNGNHDIKPIVSQHSLNANIGALYSRVVGPVRPSGMPTNAVLFPRAVDPDGPTGNRFGTFESPGNLGAGYTAFVPGAGGAMQQNMTLNIDRTRLDDRRALLGQLDALQRQRDYIGYATNDRLREQAFDVILGGVARAFDLGQEDPRLLARYDTSPLDRPQAWRHKNNRERYTAHAKSLGKLLLLARRLIEAGCRFITINTDFVWDMHADGNNLGVGEGMELVGSPFDRAVSAFMDDLEARGLSEQVMFVATGEMGRTPRLNNRGGRDHWGRLTPLMIHGGGVTHGQVIGRSNRDGGEPGSSSLSVPNLIGTIVGHLFDVNGIRLVEGLPPDLFLLLTEGHPIPGLG